MQVAICGADSSQVTAIRDAIEAMVKGRNGISMESTYAVPTSPAGKDKILIILLPTAKEDLSELRKRIRDSLSLDHHQVLCATEWD